MIKQQKTALILAGGGSKGSFEIGVWKAMRELKMPIHMVYGSSIGSINGAMVALDEFEATENLWSKIQSDQIFDIDISTSPINGTVLGLPIDEFRAFLKEAVSGGADNSSMRKLFEEYIDEEQLRKSEIDFGVSITKAQNLESVYVYLEDMPLGSLQDYVMASAACVPAVKPVEINGETYIDGGYSDNLPIQMAINRGADKIVVVDLNAPGVINHKALNYAKDNLDFTYISPNIHLGNLLHFNPKAAQQNIHQGYLAAMRAFKVFDGINCTFEKGSFPESQIENADHCANIFELPSDQVYTPQTLNSLLSPLILDAQVAVKKNSAQFLTLEGELAFPNFSQFGANLTNKFSRPSLVVYIAQSLQSYPDTGFFTHSLVKKAFASEISAAHYILNEHLLFN